MDPERASHGVARRRRSDLRRVVADRFGVVRHERAIGKLPEAFGVSHVGARRRRPKPDARTIGAFKNLRRDAERPSGRRRQARTERDPAPGRGAHRPEQRRRAARARRGSRPRQPADQRDESAWRFGAIRPARGTGAALATPYADAQAMRLRRDEISRAVAKGAHAVPPLEGAGRRTTGARGVPGKMTPIFRPRAPRS